jgi:hypothetical protein
MEEKAYLDLEVSIDDKVLVLDVSVVDPEGGEVVYGLDCIAERDKASVSSVWPIRREVRGGREGETDRFA